MREQFEKVNEFLESAQASKVNLFFIGKKKHDSKKIPEYSVLDSSITPEIGGYFLTIAKKQVNSLIVNNCEFADYQKYDDLTCADCPIVETIPYTEVPYLVNVLTGIARASETINSTTLPSSWGYVIKAQGEENALLLFKKYTQKRVLKKGGFAALYSSGSFSRFDDQIFFIDQLFDAALLLPKTSKTKPKQESTKEKSQPMLIFNRGNFERLFDYYTYYRTFLAENIQNLGLLVDEIPPFLDCCCGDTRKLKKMVSVLKSSSYSALTNDKIQNMCSEYELEVKLNKEGKIVFQKEQIWPIIRILNEDYLKSEVSGNRYLSRAKIRQG